MVAQSYFFAVGAFATLMTILWLLVPLRVTTTALLSAAGWSWMSIVGQSVYTVTQTGNQVTVTAPSLQYMTTGLALLALLAAILYRIGLYPPENWNLTFVEEEHES